MTEFSLNTDFENLIKATLIADDMNQQQQQQNMMWNKEQDESGKSPNFFQNNNAIKKRSKSYTTTKIKSRNFLSNILYVAINREDFYNEDFIFDIHTLLVKNLNLFSLDRKLDDHDKHEMIYMF